MICKIGDFSLSYKSLSSFAACGKILKFHETHLELWKELMARRTEEPVVGKEVEEDDMEREASAREDAEMDDSAVDLDNVVENVVSEKVPTSIVAKASGSGLACASIVESIE